MDTRTDRQTDNGKTICPDLSIQGIKKNLTKNSKSKKGHNSCKMDLVISLVCTYSPFYDEHKILSLKYIFSVMAEI